MIITLKQAKELINTDIEYTLMVFTWFGEVTQVTYTEVDGLNWDNDKYEDLDSLLVDSIKIKLIKFNK